MLGTDAFGFDGWLGILGGDGGYMAVDPANPRVVYAEMQWANIRKSNDGGRTFRSASRGLASRITSGVCDASKFLFKSANGGRTWRSLDGTGATGIPDVPIHAVVVDPDRRGRIYLGTDVGVFVSNDGGDAWAVENTGFGAIVTESLSRARDTAGRTWLFAFTHGRGAWKVKN